MGDADFIRQLVTDPAKDKVLITTSSQNVFEFTGRHSVKLPGKYRSAIYSGDCIIALPAEKDHHIEIFKDGNAINRITLDFPDEVKRNYYRAYSMTEYENGTAFIYTAFFTCDGDRDDNIGTPLIFVVNEDLAKPNLTIEALKSRTNAIQYFFETDILHNNDEDEDS